jgi:hypothetical protein
MTANLTVQVQVHFCQRKRGRKEMEQGPAPRPAPPPGRVPRVARLLALAIHFEGLLRDGQVRD